MPAHTQGRDTSLQALSLRKCESQRAELLEALQLIACSDGFKGGTNVAELQRLAKAALARARGE